MGCSSCQQNNHVVPTQTTHSHPHATTHCECACGCSEPICPTPQPCTEITDSKCIIYTDAAIKCDQETVVTQNASISTALNQITNYFCSKAEIPGPQGPQGIPGPTGPAGPTVCCPTFVADIQPSQSLEFGLRVNLTNGTGPFTYAWSYAQYAVGSSNDFRGIVFIGPLTNQDVQISIDNKFYQGLEGTPGVSKNIYSTHVKVRVTDSAGQIADAYYIATRVNTNV